MYNQAVTQITNLLNTIPTGRSDFEFENFFLESHPTPARQLVAVMKEIESLHAEIIQLSSAETPAQSRRLQETRQKFEQAFEWYQNIDPDMRSAIMLQYHAQESDYWSSYLGRQAALELLTLGKTTKETMDKMSCLPLDAFEESVRICMKYAALIKNTTTSVEDGLKLSVDGLPIS